ncbi:MAG TPA: HRDC domain-containing protein, partial [Myxococcota bacterium]|nr:HRDC domain-containing protein [Myxococcota bacterium]
PSFVVRKRGGARVEETLDPAETRRFEALRAHRLETAQAEGVPPYVVASDRSLRDLARLQPTRQADLERAHGIGEAKAERYGPGFLKVLRDLADADS